MQPVNQLHEMICVCVLMAEYTSACRITDAHMNQVYINMDDIHCVYIDSLILQSWLANCTNFETEGSLLGSYT